MRSGSLFELRIGTFRMDVPRSLGYYGGVVTAVGVGLIEPPLGAVIAAVPLVKLLTHHGLPVVIRFVGEVLVGVAKPIGGDTDAVFEFDDQGRAEEEALRISVQAQLGDRVRARRAVPEGG
jgi:hypothetical protein